MLLYLIIVDLLSFISYLLGSIVIHTISCKLSDNSKVYHQQSYCTVVIFNWTNVFLVLKFSVTNLHISGASITIFCWMEDIFIINTTYFKNMLLYIVFRMKLEHSKTIILFPFKFSFRGIEKT